MKYLLLFVFGLGLLAGCGPQPEACFQFPANIVDLRDTVDFTNCSINSASFEWDFGDGTTTTGKNVSHAFTSEGDFPVLMKAISENEAKSDQRSQIIRVGQRKLFNVKVNQIPAMNPLGGDWDATDGPDLVFKCRPAGGGAFSFTSPENTNLVTPVPFSWSVSADVRLTPASWEFMLLDMDTGGAVDTVGSWMMDLNAIPGGTQQVSLTGTDLDVAVEYTVE